MNILVILFLVRLYARINIFKLIFNSFFTFDNNLHTVQASDAR